MASSCQTIAAWRAFGFWFSYPTFAPQPDLVRGAYDVLQAINMFF